MPPHRPLTERFWEKVRKTETCWVWTAQIDPKGYGRIGGVDVRSRLAHRVSYELLVGPIPEGLTIDHLCRNRRCVNPEHLEPVTQEENRLRGESPTAINGRKTHCIHGHEFTPENTYWDKGNRHCKICVLGRLRAKRDEYNRIRRDRRAAARLVA